MFSGEGLKNFDKVLIFAIIAILFIGLAVLYSASSKYYSQNVVFRQTMWIFIGLIFLFVILRVDSQKFINVSYFLYGITIFFLILVLFAGKARGGAHRWISILGFNFQPSELAKIALVLTLASYLGRRKNEITNIGVFLGALGLLAPVFLLVLIEPDLGTSLLFIPITLAMLYLGGARVSHLIGVILLGLGGIPFFWQFLRDYQKQRLFVFINPNIDPLGSGYTVIQSKIAVKTFNLFIYIYLFYYNILIYSTLVYNAKG